MSGGMFVIPCFCGEGTAPKDDHDTSCPVFVSETIEYLPRRCPRCGAGWNTFRQELGCDCPPLEYESDDAPPADDPQAPDAARSQT